jgi:hypothetical protein
MGRDMRIKIKHFISSKFIRETIESCVSIDDYMETVNILAPESDTINDESFGIIEQEYEHLGVARWELEIFKEVGG